VCKKFHFLEWASKSKLGTVILGQVLEKSDELSFWFWGSIGLNKNWALPVFHMALAISDW